jgi:Zinc-binding dehydrogenase
MKPVVYRVFHFESTKEALAYVEGGHARGKVAVEVRVQEV